MADHDDTPVRQQRAVGETEFQVAGRRLQRYLFPAVAEIGGAEQVAAQAVDQHAARIGGTDGAEQRALVGAFEFFPGGAPVLRAEQAAGFADHQQAVVLDRGDGVEVELVLVVQALADVFPVLAAVAGLQQRAIGTDGQAVLFVGEPDVQQRRFAAEVLELPGPGAAGVVADEDLRIVPDRPALALVDEEHRGEQLAGRHLGLGPGLAVVVGEQDMPTVADRDQPLAGMGDAEQQAAGGLRRLHGKLRRRGGWRRLGQDRGGGEGQKRKRPEKRQGPAGQGRSGRNGRMPRSVRGLAGRSAPRHGLTHGYRPRCCY